MFEEVVSQMKCAKTTEEILINSPFANHPGGTRL